MKKIAIIGTVGIPSGYGGFETLAENLVKYHHKNKIPAELLVFCSSKNVPIKSTHYLNTNLFYINLKANGISSVFYDIASTIYAISKGVDTILLLGVSGAIILPLVRIFSKVQIITNIDGIEWKREKWKGLAKQFLKISERIAVYFSHVVISDNAGISVHVYENYKRESCILTYGGDHAFDVLRKPFIERDLPKMYALALCRIEPENNVSLILETFARNKELSLVFIGNWNSSQFSQKLRKDYSIYSNLYLLDPIYDLGVLRGIREDAAFYVHGHSAGGTNPSLVEMMHFGIPILTFDCTFNRFTTNNKALYFKDVASLELLLETFENENSRTVGLNMQKIAREIYIWNFVGNQYFEILLSKKDR